LLSQKIKENPPPAPAVQSVASGVYVARVELSNTYETETLIIDRLELQLFGTGGSTRLNDAENGTLGVSSSVSGAPEENVPVNV